MPQAHNAVYESDIYEYNPTKVVRANRSYKACTNKSNKYTLLSDGELTSGSFYDAAVACSNQAGNRFKYIGLEGLRNVSGKLRGKCYGLNQIYGTRDVCNNGWPVGDGYVDWDKVYILPNLNKMVEKTPQEIKDKYNALTTSTTLNKSSSSNLTSDQILALLATEDYNNLISSQTAVQNSLLDEIDANLQYTVMSMTIWVPLAAIAGYYLYKRNFSIPQ